MQRQSFRQGFIAWAMGVLVLVLLMGCGTSRPRGVSTVTEAPPGSTSGQAPTSWQDARVGDRVEYAFHADRVGSRRGTSASAGQLFVEVIAVRSPWVWLFIRVTRNDRQPHPHPFLSHGFVLPMRMGQAPENPPDPIEDGSTSTTRQWAFAAGQHWSARRLARDDSPGDGPTQHRLYATTPGPLYLTNGLLEVSFSSMGYSMSAGHQLALVSFQRGSGTVQGTPPVMGNPWGPGTWYETLERASWGDVRKRVCLGAEQGYLLRKVWEKPQDEVRCDDFQGAEVVALEDALISLVNKSVYIPTWPPRDYGAPLPRKVRVQLGQASVVAYLDEARADHWEDSPWLRSRSYPIDLWSPVLQGLPMEVRFDRLSEGVYRQSEGGAREYRSDSRLIRWGTWLEESQVKAPEGR
ncbi:hypothetical protein D7Y11_04150 [Corallococcus sp. AB018]|uniref:DUF6068 family protein n=1 Tax=Corallococcus sp. AB018 TaxID=2316715 RepID=UPI000F9CFC93|nr:DUF6068 family protein [Corallococcus sp. AB018]RUO94435.1 hypothetical protein D7Y11_04150 [Corallococcus sp. AB018]